ncbi:MAG TPA: DUF2127 domain-containing protein [Solirubrobacteraceae bacterium]
MQPPPGVHCGRRARRRIDWELVVCGKRGHELIGTDAGELRAEDSHVARGAGAHRWHRCLRCDSWVAVPAPETPPRSHPPGRDEIVLPLRGKALRDKIVLRLIALDRAFHFVILALLGVAVLLVAANQKALRGDYYRVLAALQQGVAGGPVQHSGHVGIVHEFDRLFTLRSGTITEVGIALLVFAALELVEAVGLWMMKRWAEYLTFITTAALLPLEVYEIVHKGTVLKVTGFVINVAVVVYLLYAKRLFGLRGGGAADERERAEDVSWEAIERATPPAGVPAS